MPGFHIDMNAAQLKEAIEMWVRAQPVFAKSIKIEAINFRCDADNGLVGANVVLNGGENHDVPSVRRGRGEDRRQR